MVLIIDMEKPKSCWECPLTHRSQYTIDVRWWSATAQETTVSVL